MPFVSICNLQMYYEIRGTGQRLLCISGTGVHLQRSPTIFDSPLAPHFEILAYDQRGLGQTSKPDILYTIADYAADADSLLNAVGWENAHIIGISFGGMVAQELALRYPHRVKRLVLACTSSGGAGGSSYPLHQLVNLPSEELAHRQITIADTRWQEEAWLSSRTTQFQELVKLTLAVSQASTDEPSREVGRRRQLEARAAHDTYNRLSQLRIPVYICGGHHDGISPPANLEAMHKQIAGSYLEFFKGGHGFLYQDPQAFKRVIAFLQNKFE
ncbi:MULTISPECIES: alpha/beta fold hydrolase [unclassified Nostoc]|uniref:alpha/beta fold hydrolase n=1 Tax=unclassified Nostoc TaxID=2593658 RepID=UPI001DF09512|nr:alpha/beta hydrolase [Nostoc sp. JL23]MBN3878416.1 alpha/beta hydrolase [Nostoc sp. JL23]